MFFPIPAFRSFRQWMDTSSAFVRAWVRSPRSVGMVCPSGMPLARSMAAFAPRKGDGLVVELGAGTGTVTRQLLDAGIAPRRLVVVEQSPVMVSLLRERFPQLAILEADARWLADCLPRDRQVDCIVSSLPLLSLNERVRNQIISAMFEVLHEGGLLIQYARRTPFSRTASGASVPARYGTTYRPPAFSGFAGRWGRVFGEDVKIGEGREALSGERAFLPPPNLLPPSPKTFGR